MKSGDRPVHQEPLDHPSSPMQSGDRVAVLTHIIIREPPWNLVIGRCISSSLAPECPEQAQSIPEQPRAAQSSPEQPRTAQSSPEQVRAASWDPFILKEH